MANGGIDHGIALGLAEAGAAVAVLGRHDFTIPFLLGTAPPSVPLRLRLEILERFSPYGTITQQTQEEAANVALRELLVQAEQDHEFKATTDRVKALKEESPKI